MRKKHYLCNSMAKKNANIINFNQKDYDTINNPTD